MSDDSTSEDEVDHHRIGSTDDLSDGERLFVDLSDREICVFNIDGEFYALANYCPHQGGPACEGTIAGTLSVDDDLDLCYEKDGRILSCPWHGWEFDVTTGRALTSREFAIPQYDVVERDGDLYVRRQR